MEAARFLDDTHSADAAEIQARFADDPELMREVIEIFLADFPERLVGMRTALARNDAATVMLHAHSLKGSAGAIGASQVAAAAAAVEALARRHALADAGPACNTIVEQLERVVPVLTALLARSSTGAAAA